MAAHAIICMSSPSNASFFSPLYKLRLSVSGPASCVLSVSVCLHILLRFSAMAFFTPKVANVVLVLILFMVVFQEASVFISVNGCFYANAAHSHNRKALADLKKNMELNDSLHESAGAANTENLVGWELRTSPSGPDPLHQNGVSPKKPRTP